MGSQPYSRDYFRNITPGSLTSAREIVPLVIELVRPRSVIDVGCGRGAWLSVFKELGVETIYGVDSDYVDPRDLLFPAERFTPIDLGKPFCLPMHFDLVVSLEVAEHLAAESAENFIDSLTRLAPVVLFSSAIPHQGGRHHVNEQWPEYWAKLFQARGYQVIDPLRKRFWKNPRVEWWYAQNIFLYATREAIERIPQLKRELENTCPSQLSLVHPRKYLEACVLENAPVRKLLSVLPSAVKRAIQRRVSRLFSKPRSRPPT
jgi:SAM-dependent methyltransferase